MHNLMIRVVPAKRKERRVSARFLSKVADFFQVEYMLSSIVYRGVLRLRNWQCEAFRRQWIASPGLSRYSRTVRTKVHKHTTAVSVDCYDVVYGSTTALFW